MLLFPKVRSLPSCLGVGEPEDTIESVVIVLVILTTGRLFPGSLGFRLGNRLSECLRKGGQVGLV